MKCPRCKVNIADNSKYCPRCGMLFDIESDNTISEELSVDHYIGYYVEELDRGKDLKRFSLLYFLFPFSTPMYYKMPFISINLLLLVLHFFFAAIFVGNKTGPFAALYILFSLLGTLYYWFYYAFNFNRLRVEDAKIRIWKAERDNKDKGDEAIEEAIKKDSKGSLLLFIIPFAAVPIICGLFLKLLEYLLSL